VRDHEGRVGSFGRGRGRAGIAVGEGDVAVVLNDLKDRALAQNWHRLLKVVDQVRHVHALALDHPIAPEIPVMSEKGPRWLRILRKAPNRPNVRLDAAESLNRAGYLGRDAERIEDLLIEQIGVPERSQLVVNPGGDAGSQLEVVGRVIPAEDVR